MNENINDKIYNQDWETQYIWTTLERLDEMNIEFHNIKEDTLRGLKAFYEATKDKEEWNSVEDMTIAIQAKIRLTGWNSGYAIKSANERGKAERRRHREGK